MAFLVKIREGWDPPPYPGRATPAGYPYYALLWTVLNSVSCQKWVVDKRCESFERACMSSEIFLKSWSSLWTFHCRLLQPSEGLSALKVRPLAHVWVSRDPKISILIHSFQVNSTRWKRDLLHTRRRKKYKCKLSLGVMTPTRVTCTRLLVILVRNSFLNG